MHGAGSLTSNEYFTKYYAAHGTCLLLRRLRGGDVVRGNIYVLKAVTAPASSNVSVARVDLSQFDADQWDADAVRCGASMRSAYVHLKRIGLKHILRGAPQIYQVLLERDGRRVRIGHYTLIRKSGLCSFYDGLNLFPEHRDLWGEAMRAALTEAGPGAFDYGWQWSPEPPRDEQIAAISGAALVSTRQILIQGVDFANWPDWEA